MKEQLIKEQERGWSSLGDKYVCAKCFNDDVLQRFVRENAVSYACDYCGGKSKKAIAAPIDEVVEIIDAAIREEWGDPNDELPYETREGGYLGTVLSSWNIFREELYEFFNSDSLLDELADSFADRMFCQRDYFGLPRSDALRFGWQEFCRVVKHKSRYVFLAEKSAYRFGDEIEPSNFLENLGDVITQTGLIRRLKPGTRFYRVRVHKPSITPKDARSLGAPAQEHALYSNRMSPAGIPLFYGAFDRRTAVKETYDPEQGTDVRITTGEFVTARSFAVCDFTRLPPIPSFFDVEHSGMRQVLLFLHDFVADLSKPITKDGREHIEYVPTQVVTEYLRRVYSHPSLGDVKGILYRSAQRKGGVCCALFFDAADCTDISSGWKSRKGDFGSPKWWLGLDPDSISRRKPRAT